MVILLMGLFFCSILFILYKGYKKYGAESEKSQEKFGVFEAKLEELAEKEVELEYRDIIVDRKSSVIERETEVLQKESKLEKK